jgi:hypothetical protein
MKATRTEKLIIIDECPSDLLNNLDSLAYSRLSGDGALLIHSNDLAELIPGISSSIPSWPGPSRENILKVVEALKEISGAQITVNEYSIPDAFVLLRRW